MAMLQQVGSHFWSFIIAKIRTLIKEIVLKITCAKYIALSYLKGYCLWTVHPQRDTKKKEKKEKLLKMLKYYQLTIKNRAILC